MARIYKTLEELSKMENITEWVWRDLIIRDHVTILASRGGVGKSSLALWIAHELAKEEKKTLYIDAERTGCTHGDRAKAWGLDHTDNIIFVCEDIGEDVGESRIEPTGLGSPEELLAAAMDIKPDLIIIDSMTFSAANIKTMDRGEAIKYMDGLKIVSAKMKCGLLLLAHTNKKQDPAEQLTNDSIYGSGGITDAARSVMTLDYVNAKDEPNKRILVQTKSNYNALAEPIQFTLNLNGISDFAPFKGHKGKSGVRAQEFRSLVFLWWKEGKTLVEIQELLKQNSDASPNERSRAIKKVTNDNNITWE
jgi:RecA-family ATPase